MISKKAEFLRMSLESRWANEKKAATLQLQRTTCLHSSQIALFKCKFVQCSMVFAKCLVLTHNSRLNIRCQTKSFPSAQNWRAFNEFTCMVQTFSFRKAHTKANISMFILRNVLRETASPNGRKQFSQKNCCHFLIGSFRTQSKTVGN